MASESAAIPKNDNLVIGHNSSFDLLFSLPLGGFSSHHTVCDLHGAFGLRFRGQGAMHDNIYGLISAGCHPVGWSDIVAKD